MLAPDCIYSSTKRFTFTKSFQLHGARRISTLLSSFGDVILLPAMAGKMQATATKPRFPLIPFSAVERLQSRSRESFRKSLEEAYRAFSYTGTSILLRTPSGPTLPPFSLPLDFVSFCLSLSIMGFRRSLANYRNPVYRVNSFLRYYGLIIMQRISRYCAPAVCCPSSLRSAEAGFEARKREATTFSRRSESGPGITNTFKSK